VLSAADVGANHERERIWIVGKNTEQSRFFSHSLHNGNRWGQQQSESIKEKNGDMADSCSKGLQRHRKQRGIDSTKECKTIPWSSFIGGSREWWESEPNVGRVANGVVARVDRIKAIGNGQVPLCAATAWRLLKERLDGHKQRGVEKHL
jgi:DNA (cytosine-5)-methyltransferase 1